MTPKALSSMSNLQEQNWEEEFDNLPNTEMTTKDFIRSLLTQQNEEVIRKIDEVMEKENYDIMVCTKCKSFIKERFSHHSEDGFSECCGKKLERVQGEKLSASYKNEILQEIKSLLSPHKGE